VTGDRSPPQPTRSPTSTNSRAAWPNNPLDFAKQYFPTKIVTDISQAGAPRISTHLTHPRGIAANPTINLLGGKGLVVARGTVPSGNTLIAPGYHHLDVITAAPVQNNGKPELISTMLAQFAGS